MSKTIELLEAFKAAKKTPSDNQAAIAIGVTRSAVSHWRKEKGHASPHAIKTMCEGTGESLAKWLPLIEAERAPTAADRKVWLRLAATAASVAVAFLVPVLTRMSIM